MKTKFWVAVCHYHDWIDMLETYASIIDTSQGQVMRDALEGWVNDVNSRLSSLPPDEWEVAVKNGHSIADNFGTEL